MDRQVVWRFAMFCPQCPYNRGLGNKIDVLRGKAMQEVKKDT